MQIHIGLVSLPGPDAAATRTAPRRFFIAATLPCGNDIAGFLSSRRRGLARRQRELHREGFSSPPLSCAATIQQDFLGFIADTLPRSNDTTKFLAFRCRGLAQRPRKLRREGFLLPTLSRAATISQDFLGFIAATPDLTNPSFMHQEGIAAAIPSDFVLRIPVFSVYSMVSFFLPKIPKVPAAARQISDRIVRVMPVRDPVDGRWTIRVL